MDSQHDKVLGGPSHPECASMTQDLAGICPDLAAGSSQTGFPHNQAIDLTWDSTKATSSVSSPYFAYNSWSISASEAVQSMTDVLLKS
jgi:hypothetical protein